MEANPAIAFDTNITRESNRNMRLIEFSDATTFLERTRGFLLESEGENNLLLSSALTLARSSAQRSSRLSFFIVEDQSQVSCAALNASDRRLLLSAASPDAARFMGSELARRETRVRGLLGPESSTESLCNGFSEGLGPSSVRARFELRLSQNVMRLDSPRPFDTSPGLFRTAKGKDLKGILKWSFNFVKECGLDERPEETEEMVHRYLENRQLFLWEYGGVAVAMAGYGGVTPGGARVNMVYTDPAHRARGYAGTLVHLLSRKLMSEGHKSCFLFCDARDPIANHVYRKLGYKIIGSFAEHREAQRPLEQAASL